MNCTDIEEQLLDYDNQPPEQRRMVDAHVSACEPCSAFLAALNEVDFRLDRKFSAIQTSPAFDDRVRSRIQTQDAAMRKPSVVPELLDFVGYLSLAAALLVILVSLYPNSTSLLARLTLDSPPIIAAEIVVVVMAIGFGIKVYSDLRPDAR